MMLWIANFYFMVFMMLEIRRNGVILTPYVVSQLLLILGCVNILAFSAEYPRLIFALSWNILFAMIQLSFALIAMLIYKFYEKEPNKIMIFDQ